VTIAYRGGGSTSNGLSSAVVTMSTTAQDGDYLIAMLACDTASNTRTWPSDFTERGIISSTVDGHLTAWADKIAGASEPSTYTIACSSTGNNFSTAVVAYSGVDTTTPRDVTPTASAAPSSTSSPWNCTAPGVATGSANRWLVWIGAVDTASQAGAVTSATPGASPATWVERQDTSDGAWANVATCDCLDSAGTYTSNVTGVQTLGGTGGAMAFLIALRAATGGGSSFIARQPYMRLQAINRARTY
jgi:hypothetical protein